MKKTLKKKNSKGTTKAGDAEKKVPGTVKQRVCPSSHAVAGVTCVSLDPFVTT